MRCPECEGYISIEDWTDDTPFECPSCGVLLKLDTDEGSYTGAAQKNLLVIDDE